MREDRPDGDVFFHWRSRTAELSSLLVFMPGRRTGIELQMTPYGGLREFVLLCPRAVPFASLFFFGAGSFCPFIFGDGFGEIFGGEPEPCSMRVA